LPMSSFSPGPEKQDLIAAGDLLLAPAICYEIAFPELVRNSLRTAAAIVTISEDGWFGDSIGPHQHLQIAQMRAVETGRPVLRATTSGISAVIDDKGKVIARAPQFEATVLNSHFQGMQGETPWQRMGLWPLLFLCVLGVWLARDKRQSGGR
jgi:apolipoprotein N-acyltransferase